MKKKNALVCLFISLVCVMCLGLGFYLDIYNFKNVNAYDLDAFEKLFNEEFTSSVKFADNFKKVQMLDRTELEKSLVINNEKDSDVINTLPGCPVSKMLDGDIYSHWMYNYNAFPYVEKANIHFSFSEETYLTGFVCLHNVNNENKNYDGKMTFYKLYTRNSDSEEWELAVDCKMPKLFGVDYTYFANPVKGKQFKIYSDVNLISDFNLYYVPVNDNVVDEMLKETDKMIEFAKGQIGDTFAKIRKIDYDKIVKERDSINDMPSSTVEEKFERSKKIIEVAGEIKRSVLVDVSGGIIKQYQTAKELLDSAVVGNETMCYSEDVYKDFKEKTDRAGEVIKKDFECRGVVEDLKSYFSVENRLFGKKYKRPNVSSNNKPVPYKYSGRVNLESIVDGSDDRVALDPAYCDISSNFHIDFDFDKKMKFNGIHLSIWQASSQNAGLDNFSLKYKDNNGNSKFVKFNYRPSGYAEGCTYLEDKGTSFSVEEYYVYFSEIETCHFEFYPMDNKNKNVTSVDEIEFIFSDLKSNSNMSFDKTNITLKEGEEATIKLNSEFPYYMPDKKVLWKSTDNDVATVKNGVIKAKTLKDGLNECMVRIVAYSRYDENINVTCDVKIIKNLHNVSFVDEYGNEIETIELSHGTKIKYPEKVPEKESEQYLFTFDNWYINDKKVDLNLTITEDIVVVAKFNKTAKTFNVTFDGYAKTQVVEYGGKVNPVYDPEKPDLENKTYKFDGWYNGNEKWDFETCVVKNDLKLTPKFIVTEIAEDVDSSANENQFSEDSSSLSDNVSNGGCNGNFSGGSVVLSCSLLLSLMIFSLIKRNSK